MKRLEGKVALVTGGSRGIGAATAKRLAEDGANIAISYVSSEKAAQELTDTISKEYGVKAKAYRADAADSKASKQLVQQVVKDFGALHIMVANAGVFITNLIDVVDEAEFDKTFNVNVKGVFAGCQEASSIMKQDGRIVVIGSVLGQRALGAGMSVYTMSKFAVQGLGRALAHDLAAKGITVNVVQPGPIDTDMNPADSDMAKHFIETIPLKRYGKPAEVAAAVAFFASPETSFITGSILNVDGGLSA